MEDAYRPEAWRDLYVMLGGSAAALSGLLFVAISIHLDRILRVPYLRVFARNSMIALIMALIRASLILVPQSAFLLAIELLLTVAFGLALVTNALLHQFRDAPLARKLPVITIVFCDLLMMAGAASLIVQTGGGMYVVTVAYLIFLCLIVARAWALLIGIYQHEDRPKVP
jgi:modulator of FtsH protease